MITYLFISLLLIVIVTIFIKWGINQHPEWFRNLLNRTQKSTLIASRVHQTEVRALIDLPKTEWFPNIKIYTSNSISDPAGMYIRMIQIEGEVITILSKYQLYRVKRAVYRKHKPSLLKYKKEYKQQQLKKLGYLYDR